MESFTKDKCLKREKLCFKQILLQTSEVKKCFSDYQAPVDTQM